MEDRLAQTVLDLMERNPHTLSPLGAGVLAASHLGIAQDSRSFAKKLGIAHALVLRECVALADEYHMIDLEDREDRSQRVFFSLTELGQDAVTGGHTS